MVKKEKMSPKPVLWQFRRRKIRNRVLSGDFSNKTQSSLRRLPFLVSPASMDMKLVEKAIEASVPSRQHQTYSNSFTECFKTLFYQRPWTHLHRPNSRSPIYPLHDKTPVPAMNCSWPRCFLSNDQIAKIIYWACHCIPRDREQITLQSTICAIRSELGWGVISRVLHQTLKHSTFFLTEIKERFTIYSLYEISQPSLSEDKSTQCRAPYECTLVLWSESYNISL